MIKPNETNDSLRLRSNATKKRSISAGLICSITRASSPIGFITDLLALKRAFLNDHICLLRPLPLERRALFLLLRLL